MRALLIAAGCTIALLPCDALAAKLTFRVHASGEQAYDVEAKGDRSGTNVPGECVITWDHSMRMRSIFTNLEKVMTFDTKTGRFDGPLEVLQDEEVITTDVYDHEGDSSCGGDHRPKPEKCEAVYKTTMTFYPGWVIDNQTEKLAKGVPGRLALEGLRRDENGACPQLLGPSPGAWVRYFMPLTNADDDRALAHVRKAKLGKWITLEGSRITNKHGETYSEGTWTTELRVHWEVRLKRIS